jgi:hypothetical protein
MKFNTFLIFISYLVVLFSHFYNFYLEIDENVVFPIKDFLVAFYFNKDHERNAISKILIQ